MIKNGKSLKWQAEALIEDNEQFKRPKGCSPVCWELAYGLAVYSREFLERGALVATVSELLNLLPAPDLGAETEAELKRACANWVTHQSAPHWLEAAGLHAHAAAVREASAPKKIHAAVDAAAFEVALATAETKAAMEVMGAAAARKWAAKPSTVLPNGWYDVDRVGYDLTRWCGSKAVHDCYESNRYDKVQRPRLTWVESVYNLQAEAAALAVLLQAADVFKGQAAAKATSINAAVKQAVGVVKDSHATPAFNNAVAFMKSCIEGVLVKAKETTTAEQDFWSLKPGARVAWFNSNEAAAFGTVCETADLGQPVDGVVIKWDDDLGSLFVQRASPKEKLNNVLRHLRPAR